MGRAIWITGNLLIRGSLDEYLARWLREQEDTGTPLTAGSFVTDELATEATLGPSAPVAPPGFDYWISEASRMRKSGMIDNPNILFCAVKARDAARSDIQWAQASNLAGIAQLQLGKPDESIVLFATIAEKFSTSIDSERQRWHVLAGYGKSPCRTGNDMILCLHCR